VKPLERLSPDCAQVNALGFEIYMRQEKYVLAVKSLSKLAKAGHPELKANIGRFEKAVQARADLDPKIKSVIDAQLTDIKKA
jgi:peptide alpha-N-acetyltransferase